MIFEARRNTIFARETPVITYTIRDHSDKRVFGHVLNFKTEI